MYSNCDRQLLLTICQLLLNCCPRRTYGNHASHDQWILWKYPPSVLAGTRIVSTSMALLLVQCLILAEELRMDLLVLEKNARASSNCHWSDKVIFILSLHLDIDA